MRMYIYGLYDRRGRLRYIGKTISPAKRLRGHWVNRRRGTGLKDCERKNEWLRSLPSPPEMRVLVIVESEIKHQDGELCREAAFMEVLIKEAAIYEFGPEQILNAKYWRQIK